MAHPFCFGVTAATTDPHALARHARRAEELGYGAVSVADHLGDQLAPLLALGAVAAATTTLRLTTLVLANDLRHPAVLAKEAATLDVLSAGRLELGLGAGWMRADYDAAGLAYDAPGTRIDRLAEAIAVVKGLFAGDPFSFAGAHYRIDGLAGTPRPVQQPHPPLLVAGGGPRILALAGREADIVGLNPRLGAGVVDHRAGPSATPEATDDKVRVVREAASGRPSPPVLHTRVHLAAIDDDRDALAAALAPALGMNPVDALASPHALVGTVDQCVDAVRRWRDRWGISYVGIDAASMEAMAPVVERLAGT